jgi:general secretion pathway protein L
MMFTTLMAFWRGLADGLSDVVIAGVDRVAGPRRYRIVLADGRSAVHDAAGTELGQLVGTDSAARFDPPDLTLRLAGSVLDVEIPLLWIFRRSLNPIPAESAAYLDAFARHQIERMTPWRSVDVYYDAATAPMPGVPSRLMVELRAVPRRAIEPLVAMLTGLQPARLRLVSHGTSRTEVFVIPICDRADIRRRRMRRVMGALLLAAAFLVASGVGWLCWQVALLDSEITDLDHQIEDRNAFLAAAAERGQSEANGAEDLRALRASRPRAVELLDALSAALPDRAYLTDFTIQKDHLRISGVSDQISGLVPSLEQSHRFSDVAFFAATTLLEAGGADRFHLDMRVPGLPAGERPASEAP